MTKKIETPIVENRNSKEYMDKIRKMPLKKLPSYLKEMIVERDRLIDNNLVADLHVYVSPTNKKGAPTSVSTIPVADCSNCSGCSLHCYDLRHDCRAKTVRETRIRNSAILKADPTRFFREINGACKMVDKFRWHVGGDVNDMFYWENVVFIALDNPHCKFHIFTKSYEVVNEWIAKNGGDKSCLPSNLNLRFSVWKTEIPNPYEIPTAEVIFDDEFVPTKPNSAICSKNCTTCCIMSKGCFSSKIACVYLPVH